MLLYDKYSTPDGIVITFGMPQGAQMHLLSVWTDYNLKILIVYIINKIMKKAKEFFNPGTAISALVVFSIIIFTSCSNVDKSWNPDIVGYQVLTPKPGPAPHINGPLVYGCRPGNPFLYRIPCQGERPIEFSAESLPGSLQLDPSTGIITGTNPQKGEYAIILKAKNKHGEDKRDFKIIAGEKLSLTPSMGWNHWYAHYTRITDKMMREAADIMISSGMADVGYQYVNIDGCWQNTQLYNDSSRKGFLRDERGNINPGRYFPDMKGLTDYIHSKGLKAGIYSSPGPVDCAGFTGSYGHEEQDAKQFADWGFDFLKYDWCSYGHITSGGKPDDRKMKFYGHPVPSLEECQYPYKLMGDLLKKQNRDIVYNLCQYGMADVWKWGGEVGGNSWRTAGDLGFYLDKVFDVALKNAELRDYSKPGEWNDPDYIQIGWIGSARAMDEPVPTKMDPAMQYSYMSLWSLMASPLFYSGDMSKLDDFTLNILCNNEVIDVNQDPLGESGMVIGRPDSCFLMIKNLYDGTKAVGMFNRTKTPKEVTADWEELRIEGKHLIRDIWRHKDIGSFKDKFTSVVPAHGVVMVKIIQAKKVSRL
jgi:alpha-galactosidase